MTDLDIDYTSGTVYARLVAEPAKLRGRTFTLTGDLTWPVAQATTLKHAIITGNVRVRDWRWLWLRRKTITIPLVYLDL